MKAWRKRWGLWRPRGKEVIREPRRDREPKGFSGLGKRVEMQF